MSEQQRWDEGYEEYVKEIAALGPVISAPVKKGGRGERETKRQEAVTKLEKSRELIAEALGLIREATNEDAYVETYLGTVLSFIIEEGKYKYMSRSLSIQTVIKELDWKE